MEIRRNSIDDILVKFPDRKTLDETKLVSASVFISSLGFEDRSSAIFVRLANSGALQNSTCIILEYSTNKEDNEKNKPNFEKVRRKVKDLVYLPYFKGRLCGDIQTNIPTNTSHIVVDISTLASYVFYPLFSELLLQHYVMSELSVVYAEAKAYQPSLEEWEKFKEKREKEKATRTALFETWEQTYFQTTEVDQVYESELFQGVNPDPLPDALIAIPNFATIRMRTFITRFQETPGSAKNKIFWILGLPPAADKKWRLPALKELHDIKKQRQACTLDYKDIWRQLEEIWRTEHLNFHLNIATLGSKMQHLGQFFFLLTHPEITLLLSEPKGYKSKQYSTDVGDSWLLMFGNIGNLKKNIESYGSILIQQ